MNDVELRELVTDLAIAQRETAKLLKEITEQQQETDRQLKEVTKQQKGIDKRLREIALLIGGVSNKFASFNELFVLASVEKFLRKKLRMKVICPQAKFKWETQTLEMDIFAYSETDACIVEVRGLLREEGVEQLIEKLQKFPEVFPEHANKALYGAVVAVYSSDQLQQQVAKRGIYTFVISDEQVVLNRPQFFVPTRFDRAFTPAVPPSEDSEPPSA